MLSTEELPAELPTQHRPEKRASVCSSTTVITGKALSRAFSQNAEGCESRKAIFRTCNARCGCNAAERATVAGGTKRPGTR